MQTVDRRVQALWDQPEFYANLKKDGLDLLARLGVSEKSRVNRDFVQGIGRLDKQGLQLAFQLKKLVKEFIRS